jgi:uroporphyrin-III C-methyltransferase/precorrin-2 dehydrogenase/sirohydrochlorin ferrochelatase
LAAGLEAGREAMRAKFPSGSDRRRALDEALGEGGMLDPLDDGAAGNVEVWLGGKEPVRQTGRVEITLTSDDPEDLTLRQCRLLGSADLILFDPAVPPAILDRARADALRRELPFDGDFAEGIAVVLRLRPTTED